MYRFLKSELEIRIYKMIDRSIVSILIVLILDNMAYGISIPFLPLIFEERGLRVYWTGITIGSFSIAYLLVAPFFGSIVDKFGHRNSIVTGILIMSVSMTLFGTIKYIQTNTHALIVSIILRCVQGKFYFSL